MDTEKQTSNEEERASSPSQEERASGFSAGEDPQGFDSEMGLTVDSLAKGLNLPIDFIRGQGVSNKYQKKKVNAVIVPFWDENRELVCTKQLQSLYECSCFDGERLRVVPYGFWRIRDIKKHGKVLLVPSEKDCWVCWHSGVSALGLPGTDDGLDKWLDHLKDLEVHFWDWNSNKELLRLVNQHLPELKVISIPEGTPSLWEAHAQGQDLKALVKRMEETELNLASDFLLASQEYRIEELRRQAATVLEAADPLELIENEIRAQGYGGNLDVPKIIYLAATSRVLKMEKGLTMPVHLLLIAQTGVGKSYALNVVWRLLPTEAHHTIEAGTGRALIYEDAPLSYRALVFSEADSLPKDENNPAASAIRNLMTDHYLHYKVPFMDPETGRRKTQEYDKPGPTVLITTSTERLPKQLDSRVFTLELTEDKEQTRAALRTQAELELQGRPEPPQSFIALQSLLQELAPWEVVVPFSGEIAECFARLPNASRIKRDFARVLSLVKALAVLRHQHRKRDEKNRIVAEIADYEVVYHLTKGMFETSISKVSDAIRRVVRAVEELRARGVTPISITAVGDHLGTTKQAVHPHITAALEEGWLVNREFRRCRPFKLDVGERLPGSIGLPKPEELEDHETEEPGFNSTDDSDETSSTAQDSEAPGDPGESQSDGPLWAEESPPPEEDCRWRDEGWEPPDWQISEESLDSEPLDGLAESCSLSSEELYPPPKLDEDWPWDIEPEGTEAPPEEIFL